MSDPLYVPNGLGVDAISGGQPVSEYHYGLKAKNQLSGPAPQGLTEQGNIDLANRPHIRQPDGSISTVYSGSFGDDKGTVLLPLVGNDHIMSDNEAWQHYVKTGEHLGRFDTGANADAYAQRLHLQQEADANMGQKPDYGRPPEISARRRGRKRK